MASSISSRVFITKGPYCTTGSPIGLPASTMKRAPSLPALTSTSPSVVNSYFAPHNHKPTTTNMAVLELGEPEQLVEIQVVAVVD